MNALRLLVFALLCLLASPLLLLGTALFSLRILFIGRPSGVSGTAYEPFWTRLFLDQLGLREDRAAARLAPHLPALSPFIIGCISGVVCWAARVSGYRGAFFGYPPEQPVPAMALINHRCEFFDRTLRQAVTDDGIRQVVILGAGWDSRAYGDPGAEGVRFFEVDLPPTQRAKKDALEAAGIDTSHVTFVETDFNQRSWFDSLKDHGFDPALPTFILWEGVTMYLDEDAVHATLRRLNQLASGSRIAFDYLSGELVFSWVGRRLVAATLKLYYGESFYFGISTRAPACDHVSALLDETGLALLEHEVSGKRKPWGGLVLAGGRA